MTSSETGNNNQGSRIRKIEQDWYTVRFEDLPETKPLESGCKNKKEIISDAFWTANILAECAIICARGKCYDSAKILLEESKKWRAIGVSFVE